MHRPLIDLINQLDEVADSDPYNPACIYAQGGRDSKPQSPALVCSDDAEGFKCPSDPMLSYVLMVQQAKECIEVWSEWRGGRQPSPQDKFDAVMFYCRNDAWLPTG